MKRNDAANLCFLILGMLILGVTGYSWPSVIASRANHLVPPPKLEHFALGYNDSVADSLWLRLIQDIDHCEEKSNEDEHRADCAVADRGWVFQMLDEITRLAPKLKIAYENGASTLSVVVHDTEGARIIYARGIENFPDEWSILYNAAFHEFFYAGNLNAAADLLRRAGQRGAPQWVYSLAAKLYTHEGQSILARSVLQEVIDQDPNSRFAPRLRERLTDIDKTISELKVQPGAPEKQPSEKPQPENSHQ